MKPVFYYDYGDEVKSFNLPIMTREQMDAAFNDIKKIVEDRGITTSDFIVIDSISSKVQS